MSPRKALGVLIWLVGLIGGPWCQAQAGSIARYALVVGNNRGVSPDLALPDLKNAERDAQRLRDALVRHGNFDPARIVLLQGARRDEILGAIKRLAEQHRKDRALLGDLPSVFAMFFTGHGLSGSLLTRDLPLTGQDLLGMAREVQATLTFGFFDACFSGSLDMQALVKKGAILRSEQNPVLELPREMMNTEGQMWWVSSMPEEFSYEDRSRGGLFTSYFIEAFTQAPRDGFGTTLDSMWEYARSRTQAHAARYGRKQTPEKLVHTMKTRGPLYFSFGTTRDSTLLMGPEIEGTFLIQYQQGGLVEFVQKARGESKKVRVYPGSLLLSNLASDRAAEGPAMELKLEPGDQVHIAARGARGRAFGPGFGEAALQAKGQDPRLSLSKDAGVSTLSLQLGYAYSLVRDFVLATPQAARLGGTYLKGPLSLGLAMGLGAQRLRFPGWSVEIRQWSAELTAGFGWDLSAVRLDLEAALEGLLHEATYSHGQTREAPGLAVRSGVRVTVPIPRRRPWLLLIGKTALGLQIGAGVTAQDRANYLSPLWSNEIALGIPF